jgi:drug/metabolite transporter (DMT)-like permease
MDPVTRTAVPPVGVAVPAALAAAGTLGVAWALQHRAARRVGQRGGVRAHLLVELAHRPTWSASLACTVAGAVLQCVALATGPLVLVQSVLVTALAVAVGVTYRLRRQRPDRTVLLGSVLCIAGLAAFLAVAQPSAGHTRPSAATGLPSVLGALAVLAICLGVAIRGRGRTRTLGLATAAGVLYGLTSALAKLAAQTAQQDGVAALFGAWPVYLVVVCGPVGFLLAQNAFNAGVALSPALAVITVGEPLTALVLGLVWFGESVRTGPLPVAGEVVALLVLAVGVTVLSYRAPQVSRPPADTPSSPEPGRV